MKRITEELLVAMRGCKDTTIEKYAEVAEKIAESWVKKAISQTLLLAETEFSKIPEISDKWMTTIYNAKRGEEHAIELKFYRLEINGEGAFVTVGGLDEVKRCHAVKKELPETHKFLFGLQDPDSLDHEGTRRLFKGRKVDIYEIKSEHVYVVEDYANSPGQYVFDSSKPFVKKLVRTLDLRNVSDEEIEQRIATTQR